MTRRGGWYETHREDEMTDSIRPRARTGQSEYRMPTADFSRNTPPVNFALAATLAIWLGLIFVLGAAGVFHTPAATLLLPLLLGFAVPVLIFLTLFWSAAGF